MEIVAFYLFFSKITRSQYYRVTYKLYRWRTKFRKLSEIFVPTVQYFQQKPWSIHVSAPTFILHSTKKPVTTMLIYPWKCTVLHCTHLGNTWKPLVLMTRHFDYCLSASEGDNQSVRCPAPVVSRCFPGGYNVKLYISRGRLAWWLLAFLHSVSGMHFSRLLHYILKILTNGNMGNCSKGVYAN